MLKSVFKLGLIFILFKISIFIIIGLAFFPLLWDDVFGVIIVSVDISDSCLLADCIDPCDLIGLDNSTEAVSGYFNDQCFRTATPYQDYTGFYEYLGYHHIVEIDSNASELDNTKFINIVPDLKYEYTSYHEPTNAYYNHAETVSFHKCQSATVTNEISAINAAINYFVSDCENYDYLTPYNMTTFSHYAEQFNVSTSPAALFEICISRTTDFNECLKYLG